MIKKETIDYVIEFLVGPELASRFTWHDSGWFAKPHMPTLPLREFEGMPILFWAGVKPDFVASAYFLLSRYEELLNSVRDEHGRFPGKASIPYKAGFLDRPLVDEYSRYLIGVENRCRCTKEENSIHCPPPPFTSTSSPAIRKLYLTHDVDMPFETRYLKGRIRDVLSTIKRQHRFTLRPIVDYLTGASNPDCFDWLLDFDQEIISRAKKETADLADLEGRKQPQKNNPPNPLNLRLKSPSVEACYFILARKNGTSRDNWYLEDPRWPNLLSHFRAHHVTLGIHISYAAGGDMSTLSQDVQTYEMYVGREVNEKTADLADLEGRNPLNQLNPRLEFLVRHHFLRMTDPSDFAQIENCGITDDFSVGYADVAGFRVGTCRSYRWIDPRTGTLGHLIIHPLTIMECSLDSYMGLTRDAAFAYCDKLISRVAEHGGECVLLWHNPSLCPTRGNWQRELYIHCAQQAVASTNAVGGGT